MRREALDEHISGTIGRYESQDRHDREMKEFICNHFEEFVNRNNQRVGEVNFAAGFVDHGADVPPGLPPGPGGGPYSTSGRRSKKFPICG